jgi:predicted MFS family arabinose efflux permease
MCVSEVLGMLGAFAFPALQSEFVVRWGLTNTQAGVINGIYFAGYALAVAVLASLTDRLDARGIHLAGVVVSALAAGGFGLFASGFLSALSFRLLAGLGLAATFIPGLRALVDRLPENARARGMALYTATFSLGMSASFYASGEIAARLGWRAVFFASAGSAVAALALAAAVLQPPLRARGTGGAALVGVLAIVRDRRVMPYILAYAGHMWELFAFRSWIVAFLTFSRGFDSRSLSGLRPASVAALIGIVAMGANVAGAELATRLGRRRVLTAIMGISAIIACGIGFTAAWPYPVVTALAVFYGLFVQGDSAALYAGALESADPARRGATLAVHSLLGFVAAALGSFGVGLVLDVTAGGRTVASWGTAFAVMGLGAAAGPVFLRNVERSRARGRG